MSTIRTTIAGGNATNRFWCDAYQSRRCPSSVSAFPRHCLLDPHHSPAKAARNSRSRWTIFRLPETDGIARSRRMTVIPATVGSLTDGEVETHAAFGPQHLGVKLYRLKIQSPMSPSPHWPAEIRRKIGGDMVGARVRSPLRDLQRDQPAAFPHPRPVHEVCPAAIVPTSCGPCHHTRCPDPVATISNLMIFYDTAAFQNPVGNHRLEPTVFRR